AARRRIAGVVPEVLDPFYVAPPPARLPFRKLLDLGLLAPGTELQIGKEELTAKVTSDGMLENNEAIASIHRMGARLMGWPACNGWQHWKYRDESGEYRPLEELRMRAREMLGHDR